MTGHPTPPRGGRRLALPVALACAAACLAGPARAQERGEFMRDALSGIGLLEKRQAPIDYHERPPLVMPPKLDGKALPAPRARSTEAAWPKDPEIVDRERAAAERLKPRGSQFQGRYNDNNATVSVEEMRGGRRAGANVTTEPGGTPGEGRGEERVLSPAELLRGKTANAEDSDEAPIRDALTKPPNGYRMSPKKLARPAQNDPVSNPSREREEADPGTYLRQRAQQ